MIANFSQVLCTFQNKKKVINLDKLVVPNVFSKYKKLRIYNFHVGNVTLKKNSKKTFFDFVGKTFIPNL